MDSTDDMDDMDGMDRMDNTATIVYSPILSIQSMLSIIRKAIEI